MPPVHSTSIGPAAISRDFHLRRPSMVANRPARLCWLAALVFLASPAWGHGAPDVRFRTVYWRDGRMKMEADAPSGPAPLFLETAEELRSPVWRTESVVHLPLEPSPVRLEATPAPDATAGFYRLRHADDGTLAAARVRCLYNGYFLTVDPGLALAPDSVADRYRLYVVNAVLVNPANGRLAALWPPLPSMAVDGEPAAAPADDLPVLLSQEHPPPPGGRSPAELLAWWREQAVDAALLDEVDFIDLQGAVVTPGLIDSHFHITSWSKKIPDPGQRFGYYADMSDPGYYLDADTGEGLCTRGALWRVIADACEFLSATNTSIGLGREGIFLHGFLHARVDDPPPEGPGDGRFLFAPEIPGGPASMPNPKYLLNRVGRPPEGRLTTPEATCDPAASDWPPLDYPTAPALLVHTSGQMCWFNAALLDAFNQREEEFWANAFEPLDVTDVAAPAAGESRWRLVAASATGLFTNTTPPFPVDLVIGGNVPQANIPFQVEAMDETERTLFVTPLLPEVLGLLTNDSPTNLRLTPFYRRIPPAIAAADWEAAATFYGVTADPDGPAYGHWDPHRPHDSNWYSGAERGLVQYVRDATGVWRPTGYAEHYVMRDLLASVVLEPPTVEDGIRFRRNVARWCHRHGLTAAHDIMFYRRRTNLYEFQSYEALSYEHDPAAESAFFTDIGLPDDVATGRFFLRVGLYYYLENEAEIAKILNLARPTDGAPDWDRLRPEESHPEHPGWVRWLGWKIQMDGGTGARTLLSNAPVAKPATTDPWPTEDEHGNTVTFQNHSFGLSTMTSDQEQVFNSRESAALYWLVRESDPTNPRWNPQLRRDWTWLKEGLAGWIGRSVNETNLARDLRALNGVTMTDPGREENDAAAQMAEKVRLALEQVNSAYNRTLQALAKIWYEQSRSPVPGVVVAHCIGDGAVDLWLRAIGQLKAEVEQLPTEWNDLPDHWQSAIPDDAALADVKRVFTNERYRVEHLLNVSAYAISQVRDPADGIDAQTTPATRNVCFSTQPALLALDGASIATSVFPMAQELWDIPHDGRDNFWGGLASQPRSPHHMPCPLYLRHDIPFSLSTDPPSVRDPRPALTLIASVARTPIRLDPSHWLDQETDPPPDYPRDYLVNRVFPPLGKTAGVATNAMQLTMEQALCAVTWWGAYVGGSEREMGAIAVPAADADPGWFADLVVWQANPLAIRATNGLALADLGHMSPQQNPALRIEVVNDFLRKFRPAMTIVGGVPVYLSPASEQTWQGSFLP